MSTNSKTRRDWFTSAHINQLVTIVVVVLLIVFGWLFTYHWVHVLLVALIMGALGGLAHEIVQSSGAVIFPGWKDGNYCLGGLVGLISGGTAGLLAYQGLIGKAGVVLNTKLIVTALLAGLAVKGVADAPNPGAPTSSPAATLALSGLPASVKAGIQNFVTVTAQTSTGGTATSYTGTVQLTADDGKAVLPPAYTFTANDNGVHKFQVKLNTPNSAGTTITATDTKDSSITDSIKVIVVSA